MKLTPGEGEDRNGNWGKRSISTFGCKIAKLLHRPHGEGYF